MPNWKPSQAAPGTTGSWSSWPQPRRQPPDRGDDRRCASAARSPEGGRMSVENARRLLRQIQNDATLREQLTGVAAAEKKALLESRGFGDVMLEDVRAASATSATGELTDAELEAVAGGSKLDWIL